jgi:hypothetical protein
VSFHPSDYKPLFQPQEESTRWITIVQFLLYPNCKTIVDREFCAHEKLIKFKFLDLDCRILKETKWNITRVSSFVTK